MKAAQSRQFERNEQKRACTGTSGDPIKSEKVHAAQRAHLNNVRRERSSVKGTDPIRNRYSAVFQEELSGNAARRVGP